MPFTLEIVTPERLTWRGEASGVILPTIDGEVGILPKHEPYVTVLGQGEGRITAVDGTVEHIAIIGGFVQVRPDRVLVLAESADLADELDLAHIEKAKARAEATLSDAGLNDPAAVATARAALSRALLHLRVAERRRKR
ncbi:MAG: ATP synthase F1 subunit epsilon [Candidatus Limnocylindrus sp.]